MIQHTWYIVSEQTIARLNFKDIRDISRGFFRRRTKYVEIAEIHAARLMAFVTVTALLKTLSASESESQLDELVREAEQEVARSEIGKVEEAVLRPSEARIGPSYRWSNNFLRGRPCVQAIGSCQWNQCVKNERSTCPRNPPMLVAHRGGARLRDCEITRADDRRILSQNLIARYIDLTECP